MLSKQTSKTAPEQKKIQTKIIKAPRPLPPWKVRKVEKRKKYKAKGSVFGSMTGRSSGGDEEEEELQVEEEEQTDNSKRDVRNKKYCQRTICPLLIFATACVLVVFFLSHLVHVVGRSESTCQVIAFEKGKSCKDCAFEIKVDGVKRNGSLKLKFNEDGVSEMDAFQNCGKATECCTFRTSYDQATGEGQFCDSSPWDCNYVITDIETPYDIQEGHLLADYLIVYIGLGMLLFLWPVIILINRMKDKRAIAEIRAANEQSKRNMELAMEKYAVHVDDANTIESGEAMQ